MAKARKAFVCSACGHQALAWSGQCSGCGEWNTLQEATLEPRKGRGPSGRAAVGAARPVVLKEVAEHDEPRHETGIAELDRVLGGGLVPGSLVLLGGAPGIGKSTLTAMACGELIAGARRVLYVTGEESAQQVRMRATRLGPQALEVPVLAENRLETVLATLSTDKPDVCVIDSIQTIFTEQSESSPGSVTQVRECAAALMEIAKRDGIATILVGHVTKDGSVAGPRVLEHLVDCVLLFEGERERAYRTVRALKNRFGATSELGVFEMRDQGLVEVADPSAVLASQAHGAPGSVVLCAMEGSRAVLVEVQALVAETEVSPPRRVTNGIDRNRLAMILAVLARNGGPALGGHDVFVNVAGGIEIDEPGADLAVALAIASAHHGEPLTNPTGGPLACFGEIGLTGELRQVAHNDRRVAEATRFALAPVLCPVNKGGGSVAASTAVKEPAKRAKPGEVAAGPSPDAETIAAATLREALRLVASARAVRAA